MTDTTIRLRLFVVVIGVVLITLGFRIAKMQIIDVATYRGASEDNSLRVDRVLPARGVIYDRNGVLMVDNAPTHTLMITPRYFEKSTIPILATALLKPDSVISARLDQAQRWNPMIANPVFSEIGFRAYSQLKERTWQLPGISYQTPHKRRYLTKARAFHALGYVREIRRPELERLKKDGYRAGDWIGINGVEKTYEHDLRGQLGRDYKIVNVRGVAISSYEDGKNDLAPVSGYDLHLTIDSEVQALAESLFVGKRGAAVALDPNNGEIIALLSEPDYDPTLLSKRISQSTWDYLNKGVDKPLFNRATMSMMPAGSTWKPLMALVSLQRGTITKSSKIVCKGGYRLGQRIFRDHGGHVHGPIAVRRAIEESCNTFFFTMMMNMDVDTFHDWTLKFGFGQRIPTDLSEQRPGLMPDSAYFNRTYPGGWTSGFSINMGIGQGNLLVTPLQLARYVAAVSNGGSLYPPHIVHSLHQSELNLTKTPEFPAPQHIPIEREHFETVREGMRMVMENGTGAYLQIPGIPSGGKTGTAQAPGDHKDHSLFILFAPYDDPQIAIAVLVENAGFGATQAGPIASLMAEQYLTGHISNTPQRRYLINRLVNVLRSEDLSDVDH